MQHIMPAVPTIPSYFKYIVNKNWRDAYSNWSRTETYGLQIYVQ